MSERWRATAVAPIALGLLTAAAGLTMARVFTDGSFAGAVLLAAALAHVVGAACRRARRGPIAAVLLTAVSLPVVAAWIFAAPTTAFGVPTFRTASRLGELLESGWRVFRTGIAPVEPTSGVVLLCAAIVAGAGTVADLLAFRARATIGALVPSLLVFVLASTLGTDDLLVVTTLAYLVAALVFLLVASQARLESGAAWASGRRLRSDASVINAGLLVGGIAVIAGLVLAPALPGADSGPLLDYRSLGGRGQAGVPDYRTVSPLVDIRARLLDQSDTELFRVRSPLRLRWRTAALDRFDGRTWGIDSHARAASSVLTHRAGPGTVVQDFTIGPLADQWLPAAFRPRSIDLDGARIIDDSSTLLAPGRSISGLDYRVRSRVPPPPTPTQVAGTARTAGAPEGATELPDGFPDSVRRLARSIVRDAPNPYAEAQRLEQFFLDGSFTYDLRVRGGSDTDAIVDFLRRRRGFCEQFAGTYAAMARAVGLPARVAVGFTPGAYDADDDRFVVTGRDAHAWPEVWLAGLGWTAFEPTPPGSAPGQTDPATGAPTAPGAAVTTPTTQAASTPSTTPAASFPETAPDANRVEAGPFTTTGSASWGRGAITAVALAAALVLAGAGWVGARLHRKSARRRHRRHAATPARSVAGAWQDALESLADAGFPVQPPLTPDEQVAAYRARGVPDDAADALDALAHRYTHVGWSRRPATEGDVVASWARAGEVRAALAAHATRRERARRVLRDRDPVGARSPR